MRFSPFGVLKISIGSYLVQVDFRIHSAKEHLNELKLLRWLAENVVLMENCYRQKLFRKLSLPGCRKTTCDFVTLNRQRRVIAVRSRRLQQTIRMHPLPFLTTVSMWTKKRLGISQS